MLGTKNPSARHGSNSLRTSITLTLVRKFLSDRPGLIYSLWIALAFVLFYWKTLLTRQFTFIIGSEAVDQTYSWMNFWVRSVRHGAIPLWDPYAFAGRPFAAEMLPSAFYPLHLVLAALPFNRDGLFSPRLYDLTFIVTHLLAAYFTYALIRELRLTRLAAFVGACCFALGGVLVRLSWLPYLESGIWLPLILLFLVRALQAQQTGGVIRNASFSGACLGLSILAGGIYMSIMQGIVVITAITYFACHDRLPWTIDASRKGHWLRVIVISAVVIAVAGGLGAVQLLPSQEFSRLTLRFIDGGLIPSSQKIPYDRLNPGMWPQSFLTVLFPAAFDGNTGGGEKWPSYIGALPFFLALIGIWKCWSNVWVRYLVWLAAIALIYSLSEYSPLHGVLYATIPFLWMARAASRFVYLASFALAILAAFGLDELVNTEALIKLWGPSRQIVKWVAIACGTALVVPGVLTQISVSLWNYYSLILILCSCAWFAYLTHRTATNVMRFLLVAFILFDLNAFNWLEANKSALRRTGDALDQMVSLRGPAGFLKTHRELYRVRVAVDPEPNIGDTYGVPSLWGGGPSVIATYSQLLAVDSENLLNVRYWIKPASVADPSPVYQDDHWKVYENPKAYPRAWVVHQVIRESSQDAVFHRLSDSTVDLRRVAVMQRDSLPPALRFSGDPVGTALNVPETVRFPSYAANQMEMEVTTKNGGLLILSEIAYPGWRATVNGKTASIYTVDGALRGVMLEGGENRIVLRYVPLSFYLGAIITLLSVIWVLASMMYRPSNSGEGSISK